MISRILSSSFITFAFSILAMPAMAEHHQIHNIICSGDAELLIDSKFKPLDFAIEPNITLDDGVLIISSGRYAFKAPQRLETFSIHDHCQVRTKHWNGKIHTLVHNSAADTVMDGFINIKEIYKTGSGRLMAYWLDNTDAVSLNLKRGRTFLAGQVKKLVADVKGHSHLSAHHLIAQDVLLKAKDQSSAVIHPMRNLTVFSENQSRVSFVRPIAHSNIVSKDHSAVIMQSLQNI